MKEDYPILLLLSITRRKLAKTDEKYIEKSNVLFYFLDLDIAYRLLYAKSFYYVTVGSMRAAQFKYASLERIRILMRLI